MSSAIGPSSNRYSGIYLGRPLREDQHYPFWRQAGKISKLEDPKDEEVLTRRRDAYKPKRLFQDGNLHQQMLPQAANSVSSSRRGEQKLTDIQEGCSASK